MRNQRRPKTPQIKQIYRCVGRYFLSDPCRHFKKIFGTKIQNIWNKNTVSDLLQSTEFVKTSLDKLPTVVVEVASFVGTLYMPLQNEVNSKSYCTHFLYCPAQLSQLDFTALFRPLCPVPLSYPGLYEPQWRVASCEGLLLLYKQYTKVHITRVCTHTISFTYINTSMII